MVIVVKPGCVVQYRSMPIWLQPSSGSLPSTPCCPGYSSHESGHKVTKSSPAVSTAALESSAGQTDSNNTVHIPSMPCSVGIPLTCLKPLLYPKQGGHNQMGPDTCCPPVVPGYACTGWQGKSCPKDGCFWASAGHMPQPHFGSLCGCGCCALNQGQGSQALCFPAAVQINPLQQLSSASCGLWLLLFH